MYRRTVLLAGLFFSLLHSNGQGVSKTMLRLPDTGEMTSYTTTFGEDADYSFLTPFFEVNGDGTVTDTVTGLMWQQTDGGEMTVENAILYCQNLTLGGYDDWRLPDAHEAFSILNHQFSNPATNPAVFTVTDAEYWWTSDRQANDSSKVWVTNGGGGIGNHSKFETLSAGGTRKIHVRAVRQVVPAATVPQRFTDNGNGTVSDHLTNLIWQKEPSPDSLAWESALTYAENLSLAGQTDWRLPNIKELQSLNDESLFNPSVSTVYFGTVGVKKYWSSTTLPNQPTQAWYLQTLWGITTHDLKTAKNNIICVRGNPASSPLSVANRIPASPRMFPNPAEDVVYICAPTNSVIEIRDLTGRVLFRPAAQSTLTEVDISALCQGFYLVVIRQDKQVYSKKLVKH